MQENFSKWKKVGNIKTQQEPDVEKQAIEVADGTIPTPDFQTKEEAFSDLSAISPIDEYTVGDAIKTTFSPFSETDWGLDDERKEQYSSFRQTLNPAQKQIGDFVVGAGDLGAMVLDGIFATLQSGSKGVAALTRLSGLLDDGDYSPKTAEKKLANDISVMLELGGLRGSKSNIREPFKNTRKELSKRAPSPKELKNLAGKAYDEAEEAGVILSGDALSDLANKANTKFGREIDVELHPKASRALSILNEMQKNENLSLRDLEIVRRKLNAAMDTTDRADARLAGQIRNQFDDFLDALTPNMVQAGDAVAGVNALKNARNLWSRTRKSEMMREAMDKASRQASGFENGIRIQLRAILNNKNKRKQFTDAELEEMDKVVNGGKVENFFRILGSFGIGEGSQKNPLTTLGGIYGGASVGGELGAIAVPLLGQAAKMTATKMTKANAEFVDDMIRAGVPQKKINRIVSVRNQINNLGTMTPFALEGYTRAMALRNNQSEENEQ